MHTAASVVVGFVALIQGAIGIAEMFLWTRLARHQRLKPRINLGPDEARKVAPIIANAGLYNWFLAAGLIWRLLQSGDSAPTQMFFLGCVVVAGVYGAFTLRGPAAVSPE